MITSILLLAVAAFAPGDILTAQERAEGWVSLFDGRTLSGWTTTHRTPSKTPVENGCINPYGCGDYMLIHERMWGNFTLALDFKISSGCNSGVFIRTFPLEPRPGKDVGFNGLEVAIDDTKEAGYHDTGALYDLARPSENAMKPAGEWNHLVVTCKDAHIEIELNGRVVNRVNLDEFTQPNRRPDGSVHKFDVAYKDHPRKGYVGLQDHGRPCWFKNIKLKPLD